MTGRASPQPFRWGLLGAGTVAHHFARSLALLPGHALQAVASRSPDRAARTRDTLGAVRAHAEYRALAEDPDVDAIYVATPTALHAEHVALALAAGKPVLCEKPFATNAADARALAEMAAAAGFFCMEAMWMRFVPAVRALKARLAAGEIGDVRLLEAELGFQVPFDPGGRHFDPQLGGGALLDLGICTVSLAWHLLGPPVTGRALASRAPTGVDAQTAMLLKFPGGALALLACSFEQRLANRAVVSGTHGTIALDDPLYAPTTLTLTRSPPPRARQGTGGPGRLARLVEASPHLVALRRRRASLLRRLLRQDIRSQSYPFPGFGYQFEAEEVARCVRAGLRESPEMPLAETVAILEALDALAREGSFDVSSGGAGSPGALHDRTELMRGIDVPT